MAEAEVDIIADLLKAVLQSRPEDQFCISLWEQYQKRGGLSKKQLEGLLGKATKFTEVSPGKLATLEAIIKKKHQLHRSEKPEIKAEAEKDLRPQEAMKRILEKYPEHKRIIFLKSKWDNGDVLNVTELADIERLEKILFK